jgi:tryptophanyl-tRNA synthetase
VSNLLTIQSALTARPIDDLVNAYAGRGYGDLKGDTAEIVIEAVRPLRERVEELLGDPGELRRLMALGASKARATAVVTLDVVYDRVGFVALDRD